MVQNVRTPRATVGVAAIVAVLTAIGDWLVCSASATSVAGQTATPAFTENLLSASCRYAYQAQAVDVSGDGAVDILVGKAPFAYGSKSAILHHPSTCRCRM